MTAKAKKHTADSAVDSTIDSTMSAAPSILSMSALKQVEDLYQEIPKQQVDLQLQGFATSIERQRRSIKHSNAAQLNFKDPLEARIAVEFFAALFPDSKRAKLGMMELFMNAIEHGNLGIASEHKHQMLADGSLMLEIASRLMSPERQSKRVHVHYKKLADRVEVNIRDDGEGFNWRPYVSHDFIDAHQRLNGRGIIVAKSIAFDELAYSEAGNEVVATQYIKD